MSDGWQSITGAPRDGSHVLAWRDGWEIPGYVQWRFNPSTSTAFWNDPYEDNAELEHEQPTYYCPAATVRACKLPPGLSRLGMASPGMAENLGK
jgi:hypothetical protein